MAAWCVTVNSSTWHAHPHRNVLSALRHHNNVRRPHFPRWPFSSHLLLLLSPQLHHLRAMLRPQVLGLRQVTLSKALLHGGQLRLLLQLQLLQLPLEGHLQRRLLPMESLPARRVGCCAGSRVYCAVNIMSELCTATILI